MKTQFEQQNSGICDDAMNIQRIGEYSIEKICPGVYAIDNDQLESMYLICGSKKALAIDTGSNPQPIMPVLQSLWDGPIELVLTHAHFDHMYHADEFSTVYLGAQDINAWETVLQPVVYAGTVGSGKAAKEYSVHDYRPLYHGDTIDLGDKILSVLSVKGHTPGSMAFVDSEDKCLFLGDAFGWMWMPGCSHLSEYIQSLELMIPMLMPYKEFRVLDGHRRQNMFPASGTLLPAHHAAQNMKNLCEDILADKIQPVQSELLFGYQTVTYSGYGISLVLSQDKLM